MYSIMMKENETKNKVTKSNMKYKMRKYVLLVGSCSNLPHGELNNYGN
jgi:hypothetical protein